MEGDSPLTSETRNQYKHYQLTIDYYEASTIISFIQISTDTKKQSKKWNDRKRRT